MEDIILAKTESLTHKRNWNNKITNHKNWVSLNTSGYHDNGVLQ